MYRNIMQGTMADENWQQVQRQAKQNLPVLFPIGVIEEHGPHLPLGADIYWSSAMCRMVQARLEKLGKSSTVAPPYYWGVNHCTGGFPGSFSLKPQTMAAVLLNIFDNLKQFGFHEVYCFNYHGDSVHVGAIVEAIRRANEGLGLSARLVVDAMDLPMHGWSGREDYLLVVNPEYPAEWFEGGPAGNGGLDIHAGAFETAVLGHFVPELVDLPVAEKLASSSLSEEGLRQWLQGGEAARAVVPLGHAGDPANYKAAATHVAEMLDLQAEYIAKQILHQ